MIAGGTLLTVSEKAVDELAPLLSVAVMVTDWLWAGPSAVASDQVQVFTPVGVTVPILADNDTVSSASVSEYVPELDAIEPSLAATEALFAATDGGGLTGPQISAVLSAPGLMPPATRTAPEGSRVAV